VLSEQEIAESGRSIAPLPAESIKKKEDEDFDWG